jgi:SAM-dependent methyltransferase
MCAEEARDQGLTWQTGVWDRISRIYLDQIDERFAAVVEQVIARAHLEQGQTVLDLGTGTGAVALRAGSLVGSSGHVIGVDISPDMLALAQRRVKESTVTNISFREGRAEAIPAEDGTFDSLLSSLCFMYFIDRPLAARESARVLRSGGRFVASVWAGPEQCDIVLFQQTAGRFAPSPPVPGVGPGALGDASSLLAQLATAGIDAQLETESLGFDFPDFSSAFDALASVTTAQLSPDRREEAKSAVMELMWPDGDGPRHFRNVAQFIVGQRR